MAENRNNTKNLTLNKPGLFSPTVVRGLREGASGQSIAFSTQDNQLVDSSILNTGSYKYSVDGEGMRSTQQINIDWSQFENHTFYNSAQVKTNVAFEKIFNEFPFDGQKIEFENFFATLTGYEKYIYDLFPKNTGYMFFSGSKNGIASDPGTYITVKDIAGAAFPSVSTKKTGETKINPANASMTIEFWAYIPTEQNYGSIILDKHTDDGTILSRQGFFINLNSSVSTTTATMSFNVVSGAIEDSVSVSVNKGEWNHVSWVWDRSPGVQQAFCYVNQTLLASSSQPIEFGTISAQTADLLIGSGSATTGLFTPTTTFSGALDELRIWHKVRSSDERNLYKEKAIFAQDGLQLYYKFNEPSGSNSSVVLDYSTNSLHGRINTSGLLLNVVDFPDAQIAGPSPIIYEKLENSPILFPSHPDLLTLRTELLLSASRYDYKNPNLITKLIPAHYFIEGQEQDGLSTETGSITEVLESGTDPRSVDLGATQVFLLLLYTWAKFFDETKLYIQTLSTLNTVDYDETDTVPDQFLLQYARNEGIELPPLFDGSSIEQFIEAENIQSDIGTNSLSLQSVRNQIWRRILINLQDVLQSKGTIHSVKSFIRSVGIDPDNNFRIREYGGPNKLPLCFSRDSRNEISTLLDFVSGGLVTSPYLVADRIEPGFPEPGPGITDNNLLTSGSWTFEGLYKFPISNPGPTSQSLVRFVTTGSALGGEGLAANVVTVKGGNTTLFVRNATSVGSPILQLAITGADLFDNDKWYVSFGRRRNDDGLNSVISSSYFLRLAKQSFGEIAETHSTSSYYNDLFVGVNGSAWTSMGPSANSSGSFITVGSQSLNTIASTIYLNGNDTSLTPKTTDFTGRAGHFRFYSKYLTDAEWPEHVKNYRSVGVIDPTKNFNFSVTPTGSFERLRLDISTDQPITNSNGSGEILLTDFTQNSFNMSGSGFLVSSPVIQPERFFFSYLSPKFDQAATTEKIRVRSFQNFENVQNTPWSELAPRYSIAGSERPTDSTRFTIDYSVSDALDQDIITLFSSLEVYDNILGSPELMYSPDYPDLETLRDVYFNKLTDKMSLKVFFEFYKWFDTNLGSFISQLLPNKTKFLGTNFVVESTLLERPKVQYFSEDIYLGDNLRSSLKDTILLRIIAGTVGKY